MATAFELEMGATAYGERSPEQAGALTQLRDDVGKTVREAQALRGSRELTEEGIKARLPNITAKAAARIEEFERGSAELEAKITAERARALTLVPDGTGGYVQHLPDRELTVNERDARSAMWHWLSSKSQQEAVTHYHTAIAVGDFAAVEAIESMPPMMSPLSPEDLQRGRERRMKMIPAERAAIITKMEEALAARSHVAFNARRIINEL